MFRQCFNSPVGLITVEASDVALTSIRMRSRRKTEAPNAITREAKRQLQDYFLGHRKRFDLPFEVTGSDFQREVWLALRSIKFGESWSYGELARHIGRPQAVRAVGSALGKNPLPILLPCHRILASRGKIGGFTGGLDLKRTLLGIEGLGA